MAKNVDIKTEIASGTKIRGRVTGAEDLRVAGRVEGSIDLEGTLVVEGVVKAEVRAERVTIAGIVVGDVTATEAIEVTASGRVKGDLKAPSVRIDEGAKIAGGLEVGQVSEKPRIAVAPRPRPAPAVEPSGGEDETEHPQVTGFVPAEGPAEERRRKRVVVKKRS